MVEYLFAAHLRLHLFTLQVVTSEPEKRPRETSGPVVKDTFYQLLKATKQLRERRSNPNLIYASS